MSAIQHQREVNVVSITCRIDKRLHAHAKGSWFEKARATKKARAMARMLAMEVGNRPIKGKCIVDYTFFVPDRRRRDEANLIQSSKPIIDGVVDAGMIPGDHWEVLSTGKVLIVVGGVDLTVKLDFRSAD